MMKKIFLAALMLIIPRVTWGAFGDEFFLNKSSFTTSNEGPIRLSSAVPGSILVGVVIGSSTAVGNAPGGQIVLFDSSATFTSTISIINMNTSGGGPAYIPYMVRVSSGISYQTTGNTPTGVTIIWAVTRPF